VSRLAIAALVSVAYPCAVSGATLRVCASGCTYASVQAAIDAAQPGDTILLRAGETFVGNYTLRDKGSSTAFITIRSDAPDSSLPAAGVRLVPEGRTGANTSRTALARLLGAGDRAKSTPVIRTAAGAHHYILRFLDIDGAAQVGYETLIALGIDKTDPDPPHHIVFDRDYIHGHKMKGQKRGIALNAKSIDILNSYIADMKAVNTDGQAISGWNGTGPFRIINNYIEAAGENVMFGGSWPATTGLIPSDITISGNHILKNPAWRNPVLSTPGSPRVSSTTAAGKLASGTHYFKVAAVLRTAATDMLSAASAEVSASVSSGHAVTLTWSAVSGAEMYRIYRGTAAGKESVYMTTAGSSTSFTYTASTETSGTPRTSGMTWTCKNLIEFKNAQRVTIDNNLFENNWAGAQPGYAIVFTPKNYNNIAPWTAVRDITFSNNILRHTAGAINILGYDDTVSGGSALTERITIRNNVFYDIDPARWGGGLAKCFQFGQGAADIVFERNTVAQNTSALLSPYGKPMIRFVFTNNIALHGKYGVFGTGSSTGIPTLTKYMPNAVFTYNVLAGGNASLYPPTNSFPTVAQWNASFVDATSGDYRILSTSVFYHAGSGGSVPGADFSTITGGGSVDPTPAPVESGTPPTADAGGPYTGQVQQSVTVSGAQSTASGTTIASYTWNWADDILIYASDFAASDVHGKWTRSSLSGAANGIALVNADAGAAKVATPLASPSSYAEIKFQAAAGVPYYVWFRGEAQNNSYSNDSFYMQFNDSESASGSRRAQIGTTDALAMVLEEGNGAGVSGWGWNDSNYGSLGSPIYFAASGTHTLRIQPREDGIRIDQIVISSRAYAAKRPGAVKNDGTILPRSLGTSQGVSAAHTYALAGVYPLLLRVKDQNGLADTDTATATITGTSTSGLVANADGPYTATAGAQVVLDGSLSTGSIASWTWHFFDDIVISGGALSSAQRHGSWKTLTDSTAAGSIALMDPDSGAAKVAAPLASPTNYVDISFTAAAGVPYRLWVRMRAASNSYSNDSVYVQFSDSVTSGGSSIYRTGTTSGLAIVLEEGKGAGVSGWGWNDANYGGLAGPVYFSRSGAQTLRIQRREDGAIIDQVVLSSDKYYDDRPGATKADKTIVPSTLGTATGTTVPHVYRWRGTYPLTLRVTNSAGQSDTDTTTMTVK
jgi:hypothetical protein